MKIKMSEIREMARLTRKHWGSGSIRDLLVGPGNYRPTLITQVSRSESERRLAAGWTQDELRAFRSDCDERARLADLYDRVQAARDDSRRAARS